MHLVCTNESYVQLSTMSSTSYQVINIDYEKQILKIAPDYLTYLHKTCPLPSSDAHFESWLFNYTDYDHIVFFFKCSGQVVGVPSFYQLPCDQTNYYTVIDESFSLYYEKTYMLDESNPTVEEFLSLPGNITCNLEYQVPVHASFGNDLINTTVEKGVVTLKEGLLEGFDLAWIPGTGLCNGCVRSGGRCGYDARRPNDTLCLCPDKSYPTSCPLINLYKKDKRNEGDGVENIRGGLEEASKEARGCAKTSNKEMQ
ncbi:hypothetical protein QJS10_CPA01g01491 [Acorus calamus]|uniref:Wall-associated receptor kinase C-terminal domain-containing protein n=1 Tax=Acorus calamus TaxID=4465 RepID=A0AAV9FIH4_ACOCL|nr:hypothetical protein QJS10_CPA01g01491 [Acorus calamus]